MDITYDLRYASDHFPGVGTYAYWLLRGLLREPTEDRFQVLWDPRAANTRFDFDAVRTHPRVSWREQPLAALGTVSSWRVGRLLGELRTDVYFSPFYLRPFAAGCPCVLVLHDVQPLQVGAAGGVARRLQYRAVLRHARGADRIVTDSEFSRDEIGRATGLPLERIAVVRPGVPWALSTPAPRRPAGLPAGPFALTVGVDKPHKNLATLFKAWELLGGGFPLRLVHAGVSAVGLGSRATGEAGAPVLRLGRVSEGELAWLYGHATLLLFPSLYEGFGFPLLEAMSVGLPTLASDIPPLRELGGDAAVYLPPRDPAAWAIAARSLAGNESERERLARSGRERAAGLTFDRTAAGIRVVLREVVAGRCP